MRRLRLFLKYTWEFMRTGDERYMDIAELHLQGLHFAATSKSLSLSITRMATLMVGQLMPSIKLAMEGMKRFQEEVVRREALRNLQ